MPTRSGLSIYCYVAPSNSNYSPQVIEIGERITSLTLSSAAPGGFVAFEALLPMRNARVPLPEFSLFSKVAVMSGFTPVWLGELTDPEEGLDETLGEYIRLTGLGLGNALRDFPQSINWVATTAKIIVSSMLSSEQANYPDCALPTLSQDSSQIFPDNPATTYAPSYDNRTMEEITADICTLAGDYVWGVWGHQSDKDASGFPLGQLVVHKRDTTTTHYRASLLGKDVTRYTITPSAERAYNEIDVYFSTGSGGAQSKFYVDPRISATNGQGTAPFRYRRLVRDHSGVSTIGASEAQAIANTYGAMYKDVTNKVSLTLRSICDGNGNRMPLWEVLADHNIFVGDFTVRSRAQMPTSPTPGVNQFYIVSATYREDQNTSELELQCDNWADQAQTQIARLTLAADAKSRTTRVTQVSQVLGAPANGYVAIGQSNAVAGQNCTGTIQFPTALYQSPTSIAFTQLANVNLGAPSAHSIDALGAYVTASTVANGVTQGAWTYKTSGNCIRRIGRKLLDWHCDGCGKELRGLALARHVRVVTHLGSAPGLVALAIDCPECGAGEQPFTESFNTALAAADELERHPALRHVRNAHRAEQARLIRKLMRHSAIGLEVLP